MWQDTERELNGKPCWIPSRKTREVWSSSSFPKLSAEQSSDTKRQYGQDEKSRAEVSVALFVECDGN